MKKQTLIIALVIAGAAFTAFKSAGSKKIIEPNSELKIENLADPDVIYALDAAKTTFVWTGKKVTGEHTGNISIANGSITTKKGNLSGGAFEVDMNTITNTDLTDAGYNEKLIGHLKSEDFFDVEKFPKSNFVIKVWAPIKDAKAGAANYYVKGDLTIKGITKEITFAAIVTKTDKAVNAVADFNVDRTDYNLKYHSGKFDPGIGDKLINDEFNVKINLVANVK